jgi:hypothetical protein
VKVNQIDKDNMEARVELDIDMVLGMMQDSEKIRNYLDNIMIVGALKGYRVEQEIRDFTFWTKYVFSLQRNGYNIHCAFTVKEFKRVENFEVRVHISELRDRLFQCLGVDIKMIPGDIFFTYHHEGILKMLQVVQDFIVTE